MAIIHAKLASDYQKPGGFTVIPQEKVCYGEEVVKVASLLEKRDVHSLKKNMKLDSVILFGSYANTILPL